MLSFSQWLRNANQRDAQTSHPQAPNEPDKGTEAKS